MIIKSTQLMISKCQAYYIIEHTMT